MAAPPGGDIIGNGIVIVGALLTCAAFVCAIWATVRPGERRDDHPKRTILRDDR